MLQSVDNGQKVSPMTPATTTSSPPGAYRRLYPSPPMSAPASPHSKARARRSNSKSSDPPRPLDLPSSTTSRLILPPPSIAPVVSATSDSQRPSAAAPTQVVDETPAPASNLPSPREHIVTSFPGQAPTIEQPAPVQPRNTEVACGPCKRAHLRCEAKRPCDRCVRTHKEAQCISVEHKNRGRPPKDPERANARRQAQQGIENQQIRQTGGYIVDQYPRPVVQTSQVATVNAQRDSSPLQSIRGRTAPFIAPRTTERPTTSSRYAPPSSTSSYSTSPSHSHYPPYNRDLRFRPRALLPPQTYEQPYQSHRDYENSASERSGNLTAVPSQPPPYPPIESTLPPRPIEPSNPGPSRFLRGISLSRPNRPSPQHLPTLENDSLRLPPLRTPTDPNRPPSLSSPRDAMLSPPVSAGLHAPLDDPFRVAGTQNMQRPGSSYESMRYSPPNALSRAYDRVPHSAVITGQERPEGFAHLLERSTSQPHRLILETRRHLRDRQDDDYRYSQPQPPQSRYFHPGAPYDPRQHEPRRTPIPAPLPRAISPRGERERVYGPYSDPSRHEPLPYARRDSREYATLQASSREEQRAAYSHSPFSRPEDRHLPALVPITTHSPPYAQRSSLDGPSTGERRPRDRESSSSVESTNKRRRLDIHDLVD